MKVTVVGAGNVGASCAEYIAQKRIASKVVLLDIKEGLLKERHWTFLKLPQLWALTPQLMGLPVIMQLQRIVMWL